MTIRARSILLAGLLLPLAARPPDQAGSWTDVTTRAGLASFRNPQGTPDKRYILDSIGGGCAFLDFDRDGWLDVALVRGSSTTGFARGGDPVVALYRNQGDGTFRDVTSSAGLEAARGWGMGIVAADYDNDGWPDLFITGFGRSFLFRNSGDGGFRDVSEKTGLTLKGVWAAGAAFGDLDNDGDLDLFVAAYAEIDLTHLPEPGSGPPCLYKDQPVFCGPRGLKPGKSRLLRNAGGTFRDVTEETLAKLAPPFYSLQPVITDLDGDGLPDIFVANDSAPNYLFRNLGNWRFVETAIETGLAVNMDGREQAGMGVDVADYDNDGLPDLIVTNFSEDTNTLYRNQGGSFEDASWRSRTGPPSFLFLGWGVKFLDADNNGLRDLYVANGHVYPQADRFQGGSRYRQRGLFFQNLGGGVFTEIGAADPELARPATARGLAAGDFDNDGRVDLLINQQDGPPRLLRNTASKEGHWLTVDLRGTRSNRDGVHARVVVRTAKGVQTAVRLAGDSYLSSSDPRLHFGLGSAARVEELTVYWPSGTVQTLTDVTANRILLVTETAAEAAP